MKNKKNSSILIVFILGALSTITPFAIDLYLPAFSQIATEFHTTTAEISLSVSSYFIGMAIGQMLYGPLLDRYGRKKPLYAGISLFLVACVGCIQSRDVTMLVAFRFLQALGGSVAWVTAIAMVRDFFPVEKSSKIFSLLVLIIGVSPLLAPTIGGFISDAWGWRAVFIALIALASMVITLVHFLLPDGREPDLTVSLKAKPMVLTFMSILQEPQFYTYSLAGAFSFASLFIYVAGSPVIFMEYYKVSPKAYGGIFALLSVGFIGASQLNIYLTQKFRSYDIFKVALIIQLFASLVFLGLVLSGAIGFYSTIVMLFICLSCVGAMNPNATALAIAPFNNNIGSASALLGCFQIGVAALASTGVGLFHSTDSLPVVVLFAITSSLASLILYFGLKKVGVPVLGRTEAPSAH